jgi:tetratricopeptide (TPR) repeat protein
LPHDERALEIYRAAGSEVGEATALNATGWHLAHLRDYSGALARCRQALALYGRLGDVFGEGLTWDSLGYVWHNLGEHPQAVACYQRAADKFLGVGHSTLGAGALVCLGDAQLAVGDPSAARATWLRALHIYEDLANPAVDRVRDRLRLATP